MNGPGPRIRYVQSSDGQTIAVARSGEGFPLVVVPGLFMPIGRGEFWGFVARGYLAADGYEFVSYDRRGLGLSTRGAYPADGRLLVDDLRAVIESIDVDRDGYSILALMAGALEAIAVAANDDRVRRLVLIDPLVDGAVWEHLPSIRAARAALAEDLDFFSEAFAAYASGWRAVMPEQAAVIRESTTAEEAMCTFDALGALDVSDLLPRVGAETLVVHRPGWHFPPEHAKRIASQIPSCEISVLGSDDFGQVEDVVREFIGGGRPAARPGADHGGGLQTILFTDLESSTELTQRVGDRAAQEVLRGHNDVVRAALERHGGREVKHTGDGIMASFGSTVGAVEAALEIQRNFAGTDVRVRVGLNAGEPIAEDGDLFGTAVQLAARICDRAEPGQILVSRVVADLCAGKGLDLTPHSEVTLKGFGQPVALFAVDQS